MEDTGEAQGIELSDCYGFILIEELISLALVMDALIFCPYAALSSPTLPQEN